METIKMTNMQQHRRFTLCERFILNEDDPATDYAAIAAQLQKQSSELLSFLNDSANTAPDEKSELLDNIDSLTDKTIVLSSQIESEDPAIVKAKAGEYVTTVKQLLTKVDTWAASGDSTPERKFFAAFDALRRQIESDDTSKKTVAKIKEAIDDIQNLLEETSFSGTVGEGEKNGTIESVKNLLNEVPALARAYAAKNKSAFGRLESQGGATESGFKEDLDALHRSMLALKTAITTKTANAKTLAGSFNEQLAKFNEKWAAVVHEVAKSTGDTHEADAAEKAQIDSTD